MCCARRKPGRYPKKSHLRWYQSSKHTQESVTTLSWKHSLELRGHGVIRLNRVTHSLYHPALSSVQGTQDGSRNFGTHSHVQGKPVAVLALNLHPRMPCVQTGAISGVFHVSWSFNEVSFKWANSFDVYTIDTFRSITWLGQTRQTEFQDLWGIIFSFPTQRRWIAVIVRVQGPGLSTLIEVYFCTWIRHPFLRETQEQSYT